jgi:hypothetical protein
MIIVMRRHSVEQDVFRAYDQFSGTKTNEVLS